MVDRSDPSLAHYVSLRSAVVTGAPLAEIQSRMRAQPGEVQDPDESGYRLLHVACQIPGARAQVIVAIAHEWPPALQAKTSHGSLPLHLLVQSQPNNEDAIRAVVLLDRAALTVRDGNGDLPLHVAFQRSAPVGVVRLLVDEGGPDALRGGDANGALPLHLAVRFSTVEAVEHLIDACPEALQRADHQGRLPLHRAMDNDALATARGRFRTHDNHQYPQIALLVATRWRPALRVQDHSGWLPLHVAARRGMLDVARVVAHADRHALQCCTKKERWLPLHLLCQRYCSIFDQDRAELVVDEFSTMYPAALSLADKNGWLPLHFAACNTQLFRDGALRSLVRRCPQSIRAVTADTRSFPLHLAAARCSVSILEFLTVLTRGHPPALRARDRDGRLPLHHAAARCSASTLEFLTVLTRGHPPALRARDGDGRLPLHHAATGYSVEVVDVLAAESGPLAFRQKDATGKLPLHLAAATDSRKGSSLTVAQRVCHGWPEAIWERDHGGMLPLHCAAQGGNLEVLRHLLGAAPAAIQVATNDDGSRSLPLHVAAAQPTTVVPVSALEDLAAAWPPALDVPDAHGRRPFQVAAATPGASLDAVYVLLRRDPNALRRRLRPCPGAVHTSAVILPRSGHLAASTAASSAPAGAVAEGGVVDLRRCSARSGCVVL